MVLAIVVIFQIVFIMLVVVSYKTIESKVAVTGNEVVAGVPRTATMLIAVTTSR